MRLKLLLIRLMIGILVISSSTAVSVERLFWDKVPLPITLPIGQERLVTFPANVRVGMPALMASRLRTQSHQGTVYWKASEAFATQRIEIREIKSNRIYLIDLKASKQARTVTPIEVLYSKNQADKGIDTSNGLKPSANASKRLGYVGLTRFAAQQLYAPARLLKATPTIHRVSVARRSIAHLIHGKKITATPVASWQSGSFYVTAVELTNTGNNFINLDPRQLRGDWRTATFHHTRLHPSGSEADTTAVYLISDRPYHEVI